MYFIGPLQPSSPSQGMKASPSKNFLDFASNLATSIFGKPKVETATFEVLSGFGHLTHIVKTTGNFKLTND